jgi:hypothetical protein
VTLPGTRVVEHLQGGWLGIVKGVLENTHEAQERLDADEGGFGQPVLRGVRLGHPCRYGQPALGKFDGERRPGFASFVDGMKSLSGQRVKRVTDGDDQIIGVVAQVRSVGPGGMVFPERVDRAIRSRARFF